MTAPDPRPGAPGAPAAPRRMPRFGRVLARCFFIQAAWNYETLMGTGFGAAGEPVLRDLPGGPGGGPYRVALTRETGFFNAHPYLAGLAIGAATRAELDGEDPAKIERLRAALCGPLGSVGDRLFWASWLPACVAVGLLLAALGLRGWAVVALLVLYNAAHVGCRVWALAAGWAQGLHVGSALGAPLLRRAGQVAAPIAAFTVGAMLPVQLGAQLAGAPPAAVLIGVAAAGAVAGLIKLLAPRASGSAVAASVLALVWIAGRLWP